MPFCDISDEVSLHYITNSPKGDVSDLDHKKETILFLPPTLLDVTWLREQFRDPRLSSHYNLVAIDPCNVGQSKSPQSPYQDAWVDAADIAMAHEILQLPPCHVFSNGMVSCPPAMCFAMLFPEKCLSLFLCGFPTQGGEDPEWILNDYKSLVELWSFPADLDSYQRACMIMVGLMFDGQATLELQDEIITWWQKHLGPKDAAIFLALACRGLNRPQFSEKQLRSVKLPTFFMQGERALVNIPASARRVSCQLPNSKFLVVKGGPEAFVVVPEYASVVTRVFSQFLSSLPRPPPFWPTQPDPERVCRVALRRFANLLEEPEVAHRDPTNTFSFSRVTPESVRSFKDLAERSSQRKPETVDPLDERGEPKLRFAEQRIQWETDTIMKSLMKQRMAAEADIVLVESSTVLVEEK